MKIYCFKAPKVIAPLLKLIFRKSYSRIDY